MAYKWWGLHCPVRELKGDGVGTEIKNLDNIQSSTYYWALKKLTQACEEANYMKNIKNYGQENHARQHLSQSKQCA